MLHSMLLAGVEVYNKATFERSYNNDQYKQSISEMTIIFAPSIVDLVTITVGLEFIYKRGFASVEEDYVIHGVITQYKPEVNKVTIVVKNDLYDAIKSRRAKSWDINIDTQQGVGSEIFKDIADHSSIGYSATSIVSTGTAVADKIVKFVQEKEDDWEMMNRLAELYEYVIWYDNKNTQVHFEPKGYTVYPKTLVVGQDIPKPIHWKVNMEQLCNEVEVNGLTVYDTRIYINAGTASTFTLEYKPEDTEVRVGGSAGTLQKRGQQGQGTLGTDYDYYIDVDLKNIIFASNKTNLWVRYGAQVPQPVKVSNQTSIDLYGGPNKIPHSKKIDRQGLRNETDAADAGYAYLAKYSTPFIEALEIPVMDSTLQTYGFLKPGDLITIFDPQTNQTNTVFVKEVTKEYPHVYDYITVGDEIWRTENWQSKMMQNINDLVNQLNQNQDFLITYIDSDDTIDFEPWYAKMEINNIAGETGIYGHPLYGIYGTAKYGSTAGSGFILGHPVFGILGTGTLGSSGTNWVSLRILQGNSVYKEYFYDTTFKDAATTGDWNTTLRKITLDAGETMLTSSLFYDATETGGVKTINVQPTYTLGATLLVEASTDGGTVWTTIPTMNVFTTVPTGTDLRLRVTNTGLTAADITELWLTYTQ